MKLYVASRFKNADLVKAFSTKLLTLRPEYECIQRWPKQIEYPIPAWQAAEQDLQDIDAADALIALTHDCDFVPGGMHFEAGYAYAKGKKIAVVGPNVHVFYQGMPDMLHFRDTDCFFTWIQRGGRF